MNPGTNYKVKNKVLFIVRIYSVPLKSGNLCSCLLYFSLTLRLLLWRLFPKTITNGPLSCVRICKNSH